MQIAPQTRIEETSKVTTDSKMQVLKRIVGEFQAGRKAKRPSRLALVIALSVLALGALGYGHLRAGRYESTDDASVQAAGTYISSQLSGRVTDIEVRDNQHVTRGQALFRLDDRPYRLAVAVAEAKLADARLHVETLKTVYREETDNLAAMNDVLTYRQREFDRQKLLLSKGIISQSESDHETDAFLDTTERLIRERQNIGEELAELGGSATVPTNQHPLVQQAQAQLDQALLDLTNATVRAPEEGTVTNVDYLQVGNYVQMGTPLFDLMSDHKVWVEADFSEVQLAHIGVGQPASITIDGQPEQHWRAHVTRKYVGTESAFSQLRPETETGDWTNVVRRSRVRLEFDRSYPPPLIHAGLNAVVEVDTRHRPSLLRLMEVLS